MTVQADQPGCAEEAAAAILRQHSSEKRGEREGESGRVSGRVKGGNVPPTTTGAGASGRERETRFWVCAGIFLGCCLGFWVLGLGLRKWKWS